MKKKEDSEGIKETLRRSVQRNSSFVNRTRFPLLCEKSGAILLVLVGLMAGWQASRRQTKFW